MRCDRALWHLHTKGNMQSSLRMLDILFLARASGLSAWVNSPCHPLPSHNCLGCLVLFLSLSVSCNTMGLSKSIQIFQYHSLARKTFPFSRRRAVPILFLTEPSPPAMAEAASFMLAKMQISCRCWGGSRTWFWCEKPGSPPQQREEARILHPPPWHNVGMATSCPSRSITGGRGHYKPAPACPAWVRRQQGQDTPPTPKSQTLPPTHPSCPSLPTSTGRGFCREAPAHPSQRLSPSRLPLPAQPLLDRVSSPRLWVWSKLDALKKLFMCARVCVSVC